MFKNIFVLESSWDADEPLENSSVMPFVSEFAKQRGINAYHQIFTDKKSFCFWIEQFNKKDKASSLLYIASHGNKGSINSLFGSIKRITVFNALKKAKNIDFIHFGCCLFGNENNLKLLLTKSRHIKWAAGYNKSVDWVDSMLFDILLWSRVSIKEPSESKNEIYLKIIDKLKLDYRYNDLDNFIENYLKSESAIYTKRSFLAFLRERL